MGTTTISVSDQVKAKLEGVKERDGHTSLDSAIRSLLEKNGKVEVHCSSDKCVNNTNGKCHAKTITNTDIYHCFTPRSGLSEGTPLERVPRIKTAGKGENL